MITGYAHHGRCTKALNYFDQIKREGKVTFTSDLSACTHVGLVEEGCKRFRSMFVDYGIAPMGEHYSCFVDLQGRVSQLEEAKHVIIIMPFKTGASVWRALLSACRVHSDVEKGERAAENILKLDPADARAYVALIQFSANNDASGEASIKTYPRIRTCTPSRLLALTAAAAVSEKDSLERFLYRDERS